MLQHILTTQTTEAHHSHAGQAVKVYVVGESSSPMEKVKGTCNLGMCKLGKSERMFYGCQGFC